MKDNITYILKHPIKSTSGVELKEIVIRRPKGRDFRRALESDVKPNAVGIHLAIALANNITPEDFDELEGEDAGGFIAACAPFLQLFAASLSAT